MGMYSYCWDYFDEEEKGFFIVKGEFFNGGC